MKKLLLALIVLAIVIAMPVMAVNYPLKTGSEDNIVTSTATELNYVDGVTSAIQTQIDLKAPIASPTFTTSIAIPNGDPTVDGVGEIAIDTTSDQFIYYGGAKRVLTYQKEICVALEDPVDADDNVPFFFPRQAIAITDVYCQVDGGTSVAMVISDGTNALESITCDADGAQDDGSITNGAFTSLERMEFDLDATSGTNTWLNICVTYTITAN